MQIVSCIPPSVCRKSKATERKEKKKWPKFQIQGKCCSTTANQSNKKKFMDSGWEVNCHFKVCFDNKPEKQNSLDIFLPRKKKAPAID